MRSIFFYRNEVTICDLVDVYILKVRSTFRDTLIRGNNLLPRTVIYRYFYEATNCYLVRIYIYRVNRMTFGHLLFT